MRDVEQDTPVSTSVIEVVSVRVVDFKIVKGGVPMEKDIL